MKDTADSKELVTKPEDLCEDRRYNEVRADSEADDAVNDHRTDDGDVDDDSVACAREARSGNEVDVSVASVEQHREVRVRQEQSLEGSRSCDEGGSEVEVGVSVASVEQHREVRVRKEESLEGSRSCNVSGNEVELGVRVASVEQHREVRVHQEQSLEGSRACDDHDSTKDVITLEKKCEATLVSNEGPTAWTITHTRRTVRRDDKSRSF
jgi:hypothetical protein